MDGLTRSQLAQRAQVNLETVRFYEEERLAFVKRAKTLGFSLEEIRELLVFQDEHTDACAEVRDLLRNKLAVVRDKKPELEKLEAHLSTALRKCNRALKQQSKHPDTCPDLSQIANPGSHNGAITR